MIPACIIGVGGYSGAGKTTLIERALPQLKRRGLYVGVLKHSGHGLAIDAEKKDTDRFFRAGADFVFAHDAVQGFSRHPGGEEGLSGALEHFPLGLDLVLVEGHKEAGIPRIWLEKGRSPGRGNTPHDRSEHILFRGDPDYLDGFLKRVRKELVRSMEERTVNAGLLVGGRSGRMGRPKGLLKVNGETLMERSFATLSKVAQRVVLAGSARMPAGMKGIDCLPDIPGGRGPLSGMMSCFRWSPESAWFISAVDMPFMTAEAWQWVLRKRTPGAWAVLPRLWNSGKVEAAGALYEPMIFGFVESLAQKGVSALQAISDHPKVIKPVIPSALAHAWRNVNTLAEWRSAEAELRSRGWT